MTKHGLIVLLIACVSLADAARGPIRDNVGSVKTISSETVPRQAQRQRHLNATQLGYLAVNEERGSKMFYMYYEARDVEARSTTPIVLWLQVRSV